MVKAEQDYTMEKQRVVEDERLKVPGFLSRRARVKSPCALLGRFARSSRGGSVASTVKPRCEPRRVQQQCTVDFAMTLVDLRSDTAKESNRARISVLTKQSELIDEASPQVHSLTALNHGCFAGG